MLDILEYQEHPSLQQHPFHVQFLQTRNISGLLGLSTWQQFESVSRNSRAQQNAYNRFSKYMYIQSKRVVCIYICYIYMYRYIYNYICMCINIWLYVYNIHIYETYVYNISLQMHLYKAWDPKLKVPFPLVLWGESFGCPQSSMVVSASLNRW